MRVSPVIGRVSGGPSYVAYQAHIAQRATDGVLEPWRGNAVAGSYRTTMGPVQSDWYMYGSPWGPNGFGGAGISGLIARMLQHGLPSEAEFNNQVSNGLEVFWRTTYSGATYLLQGLNRNGFVSGSEYYEAFHLEELVFWNGAQPMQMLPRSFQGPTPYQLVI